jgi:hypothetical protein
MSIKLNSVGGGSVTIAEPNTASDFTLSVPAATADLLTSSSDLTAQVKSATNASGSAPIYTCRAWVNFNGTGTVAIRGSGNVSSITDVGTGNYIVNFTNAMPDANYSALCSSSTDGYNTGTCHPLPSSAYTTSAFELYCDGISGATNARFDATRVLVAIFR